MATEIVFEAELDGKKFKGTLEELKRESNKFGQAIKRAADGGSKSTAKLGLVMGGVAGVVAALTTEFLNLASQAVDALVDITIQAVELNKEAELTKIALTQIFQGNAAAADAFIAQIKDTAALLGANRAELTQLAKGILPDIGDTETTIEFLEAITILGRDAGQSFASIRIAAEEALSGNLTSLTRRLNIPRATLASIEEYAKNMSLAEAVTRALQERVQATGLSAEATADSLAVVQGRLQSQLTDLQLAFGEPIADELKEQFVAISETLTENEDEILAVATALGELAAVAVELVGTRLDAFLNSAGFEELGEAAENVGKVAKGFSDLINAISQSENITDDIGRFNKLFAQLEALNGVLEKLQKSSAFFAGFTTGFGKFIEVAGTEVAKIIPIVGPIVGIVDGFRDLTDALPDVGAEAADLVDEQEVLKKSTEDLTEASLALSNAQLKLSATTDKLADASADAASKQAAITDKLETESERSLRRLAELEIRQGEARTEAAIRQAEDRIQAERDSQREREAIIFKFNQQIDRLDLSADLTKITRDNARERAQVDRDLANERISIERNFQQELRRIQQSFEQSATEAAINVDAQAFARAKRQRDNEIEQAKVNRVDQIEDAKLAAAQQREELRIQLQNEIADAREAHRQKIEDLKQRLEQELQAQAFKAQQDAQRQAEIDAQEDARLARRQAQELERFERAEEEKRTRLEESLQKQVNALVEAKKKEIELIKQAEKLKADIQIAEAERAAAATARIRDFTRARQTNVRNRSPNAAGGGIPIRHDGGFLRAGQTALVRNDERFFTPSTSGFVATPAQFSPASRAFGNAGTSVVNNNTVNAGFDPGGLNNPETALMVENMIRRVMVEELR